MKTRSRTLSLLLLSGAVSLAHAAPPVAQLYCAGGGKVPPGESQDNPPNPVTLQFNLSYYDLSVISSSSNSGSGAPAGKTTPQSVTLHAGLGRFLDLRSAVVAGGSFPECSMETTSANGDVVVYRLKGVTFVSADAIANSSTQSAFTAATLSYLGIEILVSQTGADNGGAGVPAN